MTGLPSLRALDREQGARIWLAAEATDMRCGFDRLAERVKAVIGQDPLGGHLFVFRSRRADRLGKKGDSLNCDVVRRSSQMPTRLPERGGQRSPPLTGTPPAYRKPGGR